ncbi:uncharacterized protein RHO17_003775 [Thomomys bottae]
MDRGPDMLPDLYAGGDGPHIQQAGPAQPLNAPHHPACDGSNFDDDMENAAPYKLIFVLVITLIMLAGVTIFVGVYHSYRESCGIPPPPKMKVSSASSQKSSTIIWYLIWWIPFLHSPIVRPCEPSTSASGQSDQASCLPSGLEDKTLFLDGDMNCLNPLYAQQHESTCRGKKATFLNPIYGMVTLIPNPTPNTMEKGGRGREFKGPHPAQSLLHFLAQVASQDFSVKRKNKNTV